MSNNNTQDCTYAQFKYLLHLSIYDRSKVITRHTTKEEASTLIKHLLRCKEEYYSKPENLIAEDFGATDPALDWNETQGGW